MKTLLRPGVFLPALLVGALSASAQNAAPPAAPPPPTVVNISSPVADLAKGYAQAASQMSESRIVIFYKSEGHLVVLKGIRAVHAFGGVLSITLSGGDSLAISADLVLLVTDGGRTP